VGAERWPCAQEHETLNPIRLAVHQPAMCSCLRPSLQVVNRVLEALVQAVAGIPRLGTAAAGSMSAGPSVPATSCIPTTSTDETMVEEAREVRRYRCRCYSQPLQVAIQASSNHTMDLPTCALANLSCCYMPPQLITLFQQPTHELVIRAASSQRCCVSHHTASPACL
jgi:hypothetical protein